MSIRIIDLFAVPPSVTPLLNELSNVLGRVGLRDSSFEIEHAAVALAQATPVVQLPKGDAATSLSWYEDEEDPIQAEDLPVPAQAGVASSGSPPNSLFNTIRTRLDLVALSEIVINLADFDGVSIVLNEGGFGAELVTTSDGWAFGCTVSLGLRLSPSLLQPYQRVTGASGQIEFQPDHSRPYVQLDLASATVTIDQDGRFSIESEAGLKLVSPVMIGETGVVIADADVVVNFSGDGPRPAGAQEGWKGLLINNAELRIPEIFAGAITASGLGIGSGGVTGTIAVGPFALNYDSVATPHFTGDLVGEICGMEGGLKAVSLTFQQNVPAGGAIEGQILLPFFDRTDRPLDISVGLSAAGGFTAAVGNPEGVLRLNRPGVVDLEVHSVALERQDGGFAVCLGGKVTPLYGGYTWPTVEVEDLCVTSDGRVTLAGGWIDLRGQGVVEFEGGATLELSKIGFGSEEDGTRWLGAYGGFKLASPIPIRGAVEGLRVNWRGDDRWLSLSGLRAGFDVENTVRFDGHLAFVEDPEEPRSPDVAKKRGFRGGGTLSIIPTKLTVNAEIVVGRNEQQPSYPFLYLYSSAQFPVGIPIGNTGAAFYGFAGLTAIHMEPAKTPEQLWWDDWYLKPTPGVADSRKWWAARDSFALGGGAIIGTASDNGYAVNAQLLLAVVVPGPVVLLEGVAAVLQDRSKLSPDTAPLKSLALLDARAGEFLMNSQGRYPFNPDDDMNNVIQVTGGTEFFCDSSGDWHFFLGQREPRDKQVRASLLKLFEGTSYFMLFPDRVELGACIGFNRKWKYGPLKVKLVAWIETNALVSWKPRQFKGELSLVGDVGLKAFGIGAFLSLQTILEGQGPTPYRVYGEIKAKLKTPRWLPDPKFRYTWEYEEPTLPPLLEALEAVGAEHLKVTEKWPLSADGSEGDAPLVPLDAKVAIAFNRSMVDAVLVGTNPSGIPSPEIVGDYEFEYRLVEVRLERRSRHAAAAAWETVSERTVEDPLRDKAKLWGVWLAVDGLAGGTDAVSQSPMTKLLLFAKSAFEYGRETTDDAYYDHFGEFCPGFGWTWVRPPREGCFNFDDVAPETGIRPLEWIRRGDVLILGEPLQVEAAPGQRETSAASWLLLGEHTVSPVTFLFPEPVREVTLKFAHVGKGKHRVEARLFHGSAAVGDRVPITQERTTIRSPGHEDWTVLAIAGSGCLASVCYVTAEDADRFEAEQTTADHAAEAGAPYCYSPGRDLLLPDSHYRLRIVTETRRRPTGGTWHAERFERAYHFQTGDPPGVFDAEKTGAMAPEDQGQLYPGGGALKDLRPYVDADGLTPRDGAPAAYRAYDVGIAFNEPYVEEMYLASGLPLRLELVDNNGDKTVAPPSGPATVGASWHPNDKQSRSRAIEQHVASSKRARERLESSIQEAGGLDEAKKAKSPLGYTRAPVIDLSCMPASAGVWASGDDLVLRPRTLYRACVMPDRPTAVIDFTKDAKPLLVDGCLVYHRVNPDASNLEELLEPPEGEDEPPIKVMAGKGLIVRGSSGADVARLNFRPELVKEIAALLARTPSAPPSRSVFNWSFITSRFATFTHHVHSFSDAAWNRRAVLGSTAGPDLTRTQCDELRALVEAAEPDLAQLYGVAGGLFGLDDSHLPERLEVQVLEDDSGRYGFLIESPEPLHWRQAGTGRVLLSVARAAASGSAGGPSFGSAKLIDCHLADPDWLELMAQEDLDLSGYRIACESTAADGAVGLNDLYAFPSGSRVRAGAVIRVHRGGESPASSGLERRDVYVEAANPILKAEGEVVLLNDAQGREVHRRHFLPETAFSASYDIVVASDPDGTRSFVFLREGGRFVEPIPDGCWRFDWTFKRSPGNGLPILRRKGSTADERASFYFDLPATLPTVGHLS